MFEAGHALDWNRGSRSAHPLLVRAYCSIWQRLNLKLWKVKDQSGLRAHARS